MTTQKLAFVSALRGAPPFGALLFAFARFVEGVVFDSVAMLLPALANGFELRAESAMCTWAQIAQVGGS